MHARVYAVFALVCIASMLACSLIQPSQAGQDAAAAGHGAPQSPLDGAVRRSADVAEAVGGAARLAAAVPPLAPIADPAGHFAEGYARGVRDAAARSAGSTRSWSETIGLFVAGLFAGMTNLFFRRQASPATPPIIPQQPHRP